MSINMQAMHGVPVNSNVQTRRFGTIAARIGSTHQHRLGIDLGNARAGTNVHLDVVDSSRHPDEAEHAKWVCKSPHCAGKRWDSKRDLLKAHLDNRTLIKQQEEHLYLGVVELPAVAARPESKDEKTGKVTPARPEQPAVVLLLSDEE